MRVAVDDVDCGPMEVCVQDAERRVGCAVAADYQGGAVVGFCVWGDQLGLYHVMRRWRAGVENDVWKIGVVGMELKRQSGSVA